MLDVITDFWKPVKKPAQGGKADLSRLQIGSSLTFGYVPQTLLSGRRLRVSAINTYRFGDERMTSFVLSQEGEDAVSMIVASSEGEPYLALSRRIPFAERMRMFDPSELEAIVEQTDAARLSAHDVDVQWKHWIVSGYKKEISGIKGSVVRGDYRQVTPPAEAIQPFDYVLLTSDNNEYAIEIERYTDGRIELYATIYRRVTDVTETEHPDDAEKLSAPPVLEVVKPEPRASEPENVEPVVASVAEIQEPQEETLPEPARTTSAPVAVEPPKPAPPAPPMPKPAFSATPSYYNTAAATPIAPVNVQPQTEKSPMQFPASHAANGATVAQDQTRRVIEPENDSIECELRVANKIIDEAIRNEMRLSDVVRRIIALPVANPEAVQIPIMLTDNDFQLLAIRYGIQAADRNAIKTRIIEELNDFSGGKKQ